MLFQPDFSILQFQFLFRLSAFACALISTSLHAVEQERPAVLFIGKPYNYLEVAYQKELETHGFDAHCGNWDDVQPHNLRRYNCVVVTSYADEKLNIEAGVAGEGGINLARERILTEYMNAGGGLMVFLNTGGCYAKAKLGNVPEWLKKFGVDFYTETISDPATEVLATAPTIRKYNIKFAHTEKLIPHPVTEGAKRVWYPVNWVGHQAASAAPVNVNHQWEQLVFTNPTARIVKPVSEVLPEMYRANPPDGPYCLLAVRKYTLGRMAVMGINPMWTVWSAYHPSLGSVVMKQGENGLPSDWALIIENTFRWLSEPSLQMGLYGTEAGKLPPVAGNTPPVDWSSMAFPPAPKKYFRGIAGAHTSLSTGKGTVQDWANAAVTAGLDFILFTEDLAEMNLEKWKQLQAQCKAATTQKFIAWPGIEYRNAAGTHGFIPIGYKDWLSPTWLSDDGKRINIDRGWTPDKGMDAKTGHQSGQIMHYLTYLTNGFFNYANNPTPFWDYKLYTLFTVWSARDRKPLDDALESFLQANSLHVNPAPFALDLLTDPADLASVVSEGRPHLVVAADNDPRVPEPATLTNVFLRNVVCETEDRLGAGGYRGWCGPIATQGPAMRWMFRGGYQWEGVEFPRYWIERHAGPRSEDWFLSSWYRLNLRLDAESPAGIRDVTIYDGDRIFRRYAGSSRKSFAVEMTVSQAPNRHLVAVVTDLNGRRAVSREIWTEQQMGLYNYCGDRVNVPQSIYSPIHGHPYPTPDKTQREVRRFFVDLVSPDIQIEGYRTDWVYKREELSDEYGWHNWAPHHERDDYTFTQRGYGWYQGHDRPVSTASHASQDVYWDGFGIEALRLDQLVAPRLVNFDNKLVLKKSIPLDADGFALPGLVEWNVEAGTDRPARFAIISADRRVVRPWELPIPHEPVMIELPEGSIVIGGTGIPGPGQSVRVSGSPAACLVRAENGKVTFKVGIRPGDKNIAGSAFDWQTEVVNRTLEPDSRLETSWFTVETGKLLDLPLGVIRAQAEDGVVRVRVRESGLPINCQPFVISGVNPRLPIGCYEVESNRYRPIGGWDGKAFVQVPASQKNTTLVIGNLLISDQPDIQAEMVQETAADGTVTGKWLVDAHNPADHEREVTFSIPAEFGLVKTRTHRAKLPPAGSVQFTID